MSHYKEIPGQLTFNIDSTCYTHEITVKETPAEIPNARIEKKLSLSDKEWHVIEKTREEMEKNNDRRHIFYLPKNTFVSSKKNCSRSIFFSGKLNQNMLGVTDEEDKEYLRLKPLDLNLKTISISFFIESLGEIRKKELPLYPKTKRYKGCVDLSKIKTKEQFEKEIFKN